MFEKPSLAMRIAIGKGIGLIVGLAGFIMLPILMPDAGGLIRWGILLWYITLGAIVGMFGVMTEHPVMHFPMPWWFRATLIGAWMNFVLVFFAYGVMEAVLASAFGPDGFFQSPFWFAAEGGLFGLIVGFFATRFGGEGKETVGH